jgi:hypothetical protein
MCWLRLKLGTFQAQGRRVYHFSQLSSGQVSIALARGRIFIIFSALLSRNQMSGQQWEIIFRFDLDGAFCS